MNSSWKMALGAAAVAANALAFIAGASAAELETIAKFSDFRPGNPAISDDGRLFVTMSALGGSKLNVVEILKDGSTKPFPDEAWSGKPGSRDVVGINSTIGIQATSDGTLWVLDIGNRSAAPAQPPKLVGWDLDSGQLKKVFFIPDPVLRDNSFLQDFAVDVKRGVAVLADMTQPFASDEGPAPSNPAFVIVDLKTGMTRRVLENDPSFSPSGEPIVIDGTTVLHKPKNGPSFPPTYPLNPVAIDPDFNWVYFGAMGNKVVYRISAEALADESLDDVALNKRIERYADKPETDGFDVDNKGQVYVTDVENFAVGVTSPAGYQVLAQDKEKLTWPDGVSVSKDGWLYIVSNELNTLAALNNGEDVSTPPYYVHRLKLDERK